MSLTVTVHDNESGAEEVVEVPDHEYFLLCTGDCYVSATQAYPKSGTHVLTIKGRHPAPKVVA